MESHRGSANLTQNSEGQYATHCVHFLRSPTLLLGQLLRAQCVHFVKKITQIVLLSPAIQKTHYSLSQEFAWLGTNREIRILISQSFNCENVCSPIGAKYV